MSLFKTIQEAQIQARKARVTADDAIRVSLLTTLLGEAAAVGKNAGNRDTTDAEVVAIVKKFLKNIEETQTAVVGKPFAEDAQHRLDVEKAALAAFLPAQLDESELRQALQALAWTLGTAGPKDLGRLMKALKDQYDGRYDGKLASVLCKEVLSG